MPILLDLQVGKHRAFLQILDLGIGVQADLHLISNAMYINMDVGWCL
jgi:hypothetical protein